MELDSCFDFLAADDIRMKGTRVGIESVLYEYIYREQPAEKIAERFPSLRLEQVYAAILYYLQNKSAMDAYMAAWLNEARENRKAQSANPPPVLIRLRERIAVRDKDDVHQ